MPTCRPQFDHLPEDGSLVLPFVLPLLIPSFTTPRAVGDPETIEMAFVSFSYTVAYGLSFERSELVTFTYPVEIQPVEPKEVWRPHRRIQDAPTQDEC